MTDAGKTAFTSSPAYADWIFVMKTWGDGLRKAGIGKLAPGERTDRLLRSVSGSLAKAGNLEVLGRGSSRIAFRFRKDPKFALKVASNSEGLAQNEAEYANAAKAGESYSCFARVLDFDFLNGAFMVCDCCPQTTPADWVRVTGLPIESVLDIVDCAVSGKVSLKEIERQCSLGWDEMSSWFAGRFPPSKLKAVAGFCRNAVSSGMLKWRVFRDMIRFYFDNGNQAMLMADMGGYANWGVLKGQAPEQDAIVIIDSGLGEGAV